MLAWNGVGYVCPHFYIQSRVDSEQDKNLDPLPEFNDVFPQVNAVWYMGTIIKLTHLVVIVLQIIFNYRYDIHQLCKNNNSSNSTSFLRL